MNDVKSRTKETPINLLSYLMTRHEHDMLCTMKSTPSETRFSF